MAETTTATLLPASTSRLTWRATTRMRSTLATEVPPNFMTMKLIPNPLGVREQVPRSGCMPLGSRARSDPAVLLATRPRLRNTRDN